MFVADNDSSLHPGAHYTVNEAIAWLEKQKKQTENATKTLAKILKDSAEGFRRILKKKGIDYEVSDKFWENTAVVYSKEDDVKFHKWMDDLMGPTPIEETYEYEKGLEAGINLKEQKPVATVRIPKFRVGDIIQHVPLEKWDTAKRITSVDEHGYNFSNLGDRVGGGFIGFSFEDEYELVEQKPAEWSEEDEEMSTNILNLISSQITYVTGQGTISSKQYLTYTKERDWFINRLKSLRTQLKQEPDIMSAKEGQDKLEKLLSSNTCYYPGWRHYTWNVNMRFDYSCLVRYEDNDSYEIVTAGDKPRREVSGEYIFLKDIYSVSHWKPSEEQMESLRDTIVQTKGYSYSIFLPELYEDLKKL